METRARKTVLMVDDERGFRRLVYHALKHEYRVIEAGDADAAIRALESGGVDLVLLDLHLPPLLDSPREGLRVHRHLRTSIPGVPVVVVSADGRRELRESLLQGGVRAFLSKPADVERIEEVLSEVLSRSEEEPR